MLPSTATATRFSPYRRLALLLLVAVWLAPASASSTKSVTTTVPRVMRQSAAKPSRPRCLTTQWNSNSMLITWTDSPPSANVTHYLVGYGVVRIERLVRVRVNYNALIVDNFEPNKTYVVAIKACNRQVCSRYREKNITLSQDADGARKPFNKQSRCTAVRASELLEVPMEVRCEPLSSTSVRVSWTDVGVLLPIRLAYATVYYTVRRTFSSFGPFGRPSNNDDSATSRALNRRAGNEVNASVPTVIYGNLRPAMSYEFAVKKVLIFSHLLLTGSQSHPVQATKQSSWSGKVECHTPEAAPSNAPTSLSATQVNIDTVELVWQPCTEPNGRIVNYTALVCREPCMGESAWQTRPITLENYRDGWLVSIVGGLQSGASYRFRVREGNSVGDSPPSEPTEPVFLSLEFEADQDYVHETAGSYDYSIVRNDDPEDLPMQPMQPI